MHSTYVVFFIVAFTVFAFSEAVQKSSPHFIVRNRFNYSNLFNKVDEPCDPNAPTDECDGLSECKPDDTDPNTGLCKCDEALYIPNEDLDTCLALIETECNENALEPIFCVGPEDHSRSFCDTNNLPPVCKCQDKYVPNDKMSDCLGKIGTECTKDEECVGPVSRTKCEQTCKCRGSDHIPKQDDTTCVVRIGGVCNDVSECTGQEIPGSVSCTSGQCQCTDGHVRGGAQQWSKCLEIIDKLEESCEESVQCRAGIPGQFSECTASDPNDQNVKVCKCSKDAVHEVTENVCYKKPDFIGAPEGSCEIQAQCESLKARCTGSKTVPGVCECEADHVPRLNNTLCLERKQLGQMCEEKPQCPNDAICTPVDPDDNPIDDPDDPNKLCICDVKNGFIEYQLTCLRLATKLGDNCTENIQCDTNVKNSVCNGETKTCECPDETKFVPNGANNKCLEIRTGLDKEDELCEENVQCVSPPGEDDRRECVGTPSGESKTCKCLTGQYINPPPSPPLPDRCYKIVRDINQGCEHFIQCTTTMGDLSDCIDYKCQCKLSHYQFYNETGKCYIPSRLGQPCDETEECIVGVNKNAYCTSTVDGRCACLPGKIIEYNGKCYEEKMIGNPCETDEECNASIKGGQAQCDRDSKTCECKSGFKGDASGILCTPSGATNLNPSNVLVLVLTLAFAYAVGFRQ